MKGEGYWPRWEYNPGLLILSPVFCLLDNVASSGIVCSRDTVLLDTNTLINILRCCFCLFRKKMMNQLLRICCCI